MAVLKFRRALRAGGRRAGWLWTLLHIFYNGGFRSGRVGGQKSARSPPAPSIKTNVFRRFFVGPPVYPGWTTSAGSQASGRARALTYSRKGPACRWLRRWSCHAVEPSRRIEEIHGRRPSNGQAGPWRAAARRAGARSRRAGSCFVLAPASIQKGPGRAGIKNPFRRLPRSPSPASTGYVRTNPARWRRNVLFFAGQTQSSPAAR